METLIIIVTFVFICLCIVAVFHTRNAPIKKTAVEYATKYTEADTEATRKALRGWGDGVRRIPNDLLLMPKICEGSKFEFLPVKWVEVEDWLGNFYTINLEDIDTVKYSVVGGSTNEISFKKTNVIIHIWDEEYFRLRDLLVPLFGRVHKETDDGSTQDESDSDPL